MSGASLYGWLAGLLLLLSPQLVVVAALLERSGPIRMRHFVDEAGGALERLYRNPSRFEAFRCLMSLLARLAPALLAILLILLGGELGLAPAATVGGALAVSALAALIAEAAVRLLMRRSTELALRRLTPVYRALHLATLPGVALLAPLFPVTTGRRLDFEEEASSEEIEAFIAVGTREGILEPDEGDLVRGVVDFGDTQVRSVMTPRIDMICAAEESGLDELAEVFLDSLHSRIPLFRESVDNITGILHLHDLLSGLLSDPRPSAAELMRPAYVVPVTKPVDDLLRELQARAQQIAVVVDEYGGTSGLVTVEDLVEEIVGDIVDEHEEVLEPERLADGAWRVAGRTQLEDLDDLTGLEMDVDTPYETVGGLILGVLGDVPKPGTRVESHGLRLAVESVSGRRIGMVRVEELAPVAEPEAEG